MGGNIAFGSHKADRIDLRQVPRKEIVATITTSLLLVNAAFKREYKIDLWYQEINHYLSGSSDALFDKKIKDTDFVGVKPTVGDIDVQVNEALYKELTMFLLKYRSVKLGDLTLIDIKHSTDQIITLWRSTKFQINIQIDFELVRFKGSKPNEWSRFSRSSHWDDMTKGIKGVAHKYIMRAAVGANRNEVVIRAKTKRSKDKITIDSEKAFSLKGIRDKLSAARDEHGNHIFQNGLPVYDVIDTKEAAYVQDIDIIFSTMFGRDMTPADKAAMQSFSGIVGLMKKYLKKVDIEKIVDRFADLLWGPQGQMLYARNAKQDFDEKELMFNLIAQELKINPDKYKEMKRAYYTKYKLEM